MSRRGFAVMLAVTALAACGGAPGATNVAVYDLGTTAGNPPPAAKIEAVLLVPPVTAPAWLDSTAIVYRLGYQDPERSRTYAQSRWAGTPAEMVGTRLRNRLAQTAKGGVVGIADGARADYALRVEIEDFAQVFDSADASRGVARARATLIDANTRKVIAQHSLTVERPAPSANADGAVRALGQSADALVAQVVAWAAASLPARP